jgi:hypothetical protein
MAGERESESASHVRRALPIPSRLTVVVAVATLASRSGRAIPNKET